MEFMERLEGIPSLYRWLAIPGLVVLMAALYWYFLYQPYVEEREALQEKINTKRQTVEKHKQIAAKLETFIPIQVRVKGQYHAVGRFIDDLVHLERIISVSGIQIEATSQETQCLATTFRFLDEAEANEAAASAKKGGKK